MTECAQRVTVQQEAVRNLQDPTICGHPRAKGLKGRSGLQVSYRFGNPPRIAALRGGEDGGWDSGESATKELGI